ncbi:ABC transporter ATP-binding protein [Trueperella pyogenes]|uniref:amino acid ABC transporter ATP-binding/permease protein n=1 Tax=Trueperella pyogenes TaxID=1661 RepID=UPI0024BF8A25|nr:ABC transporter ATP-binding protein [Trueperella pyogenes]WHU61640.1 ABC transporter ATP-binding protein [Trueperella pyogenes]
MNEPTVRELVAWLTSITRPVHRPLIVSTIFRIVNLSCDILLFGYAGWAVYRALAGQMTALDIAWIIVIALVKAFAYYVEQFLGHFVAFKALELLRGYAFSRLWPQAPMVSMRSRSGDLLASLTRDVDRIEVVYAHTFAPVISAFIVPPVFLVTAGALLGWEVIAITALAYLVAMAVVPALGARESLDSTSRQLGTRARMVAHVTDSVFGVEEVVGYGLERERLAQTDQLGGVIEDDAARSAMFRGLRRGLNIALSALAVIGVAYGGVFSGIDAGLVVAIAAGTLRLFEGPKGVEDAVGALDASLASARRIWHIAHGEDGVVDGDRPFPAGERVSVQWSNVTYSYPDAPRERPVLEEFSFHVPAGSHAAFVGRSGSGKTTAAQLALRFDDPTAGAIYINGVDIRSIRLDELRAHIALVSQRNQILDATVAENVRLGVPEASDDDVWQALDIACIADEIRAMPEGLQTPTGQDGALLSGGQGQRLALARAVLMRPKVLILDEFSSNLNVDLDKQIRQKLANRLAGVTIIEITHVNGDDESIDHTAQFGLPCARRQDSA